MAHLRPITKFCSWHDCSKHARYELKGNRNETHGFFCERHGMERLREVKVKEEDHTTSTGERR